MEFELGPGMRGQVESGICKEARFSARRYNGRAIRGSTYLGGLSELV